MKNDEAQICDGLSRGGRIAGDQRRVSDAVKSVASDAMAGGEIEGDCIGRRSRRHGMMERRIKHRNIRDVGTKRRLRCPDPSKAGRIVQGCKCREALYFLQHRIIDPDSRLKAVAAMHDAMPCRLHHS